MKHLIVLTCILTIVFFACKPTYMEEFRAPQVLYTVDRIDSEKNVYVIHAIHADTIYKILSVKRSAGNKYLPIRVGESYAFELQSLFIRNFNGLYDITPDAIDGLEGVDFYGTNMVIDEGVINEHRDLYEAKNLQGLYFVK